MLEIHLYFTPMLDNLDEFDRNDWYLYPVVNLSAAKACRDQAQYPKTVEYLNACSDRLEKIALDFFYRQFIWTEIWSEIYFATPK